MVAPTAGQRSKLERRAPCSKVVFLTGRLNMQITRREVRTCQHKSADLYRRKVARLQYLLEDEAARPQVVEIIRLLIDRIKIHPGQERGHCEVVIVGALTLPAGAHKRSKVSSSTTLRSYSDAQNHHWNIGLSDLWHLG